MTTRLLLSIAGLALVPLTLAACSSATPGTDTAPSTPDISAGWLDDGRMVGIVTWGSSSCVPIAEEISYEAGALTVELVDPKEQPCTADYAPRTTLVGVDDGFDPSTDLAITVTGMYAGSAALSAMPTPASSDAGGGTGVTDYQPSAGWFAPDGFSLLTWGSSTCPPELESAEATGAEEVAITFVTPPAERVCTMDMAPRVLTITLDATALGAGEVEAVLNGDEYRGVRVPILGSR